VNRVLLEDRSVIVVSGEEAGAFLDRILTNNVSDLKEGEGRYAALLTPQGKVIADMAVGLTIADIGDRHRYPAGFHIVLRTELAPNLESRLKLLKLRSKVAIESFAQDTAQRERLGVACIFNNGDSTPLGPINSGAGFFMVSGQERMGGYEIVPGLDAKAVPFDDAPVYHAHRIALGIPYGGLDFAHGEVFPHDINMDRLHGVDFRKGCYVGQEVVSRMQHRGAARTRIMKIDYAGGVGPEPGAAVMAGERGIGSTGCSVDGKGLAMIRLDKLADALSSGEAIHAGGFSATISAPPYAPDFLPAQA
jgi:tRNA-modifying protein YgfZ